MIRQIIKIDSEKCNGCGLCVTACHEGAITVVNGKANLIRDDYCDGLGNCLPACPTGAITFENREADVYDDVAVKKHIASRQASNKSTCENKFGMISEKGRSELACGCPSTAAVNIKRAAKPRQMAENSLGELACGCPSTAAITLDRQSQVVRREHINKADSELRQFPIQIKLVPPNAPYFEGCDLLVAADCTAFAYGAFHQDFIKGKITLIGCPKLDEGDYSDKLTDILVSNNINSLTVVRMEVPCCGGIVQAVKTALKNSNSILPWQIVTITRNGEVV